MDLGMSPQDSQIMERDRAFNLERRQVKEIEDLQKKVLMLEHFIRRFVINDMGVTSDVSKKEALKILGL